MAFAIRKRHVPGAIRDNEEKRDREFGGCVSVPPVHVTESEICGQPQNKGALDGVQANCCEFVLSEECSTLI